MKGSTIRQKLSQLGITHAQLARQLNITTQAITGLLSADDVRTSTLERICEVLEVPISFFFVESDDDATDLIERLKAERVEKIWATHNIGEKVRQLLREQKKKFISLCEYVGMTDPGLRKAFARDTCNITTLTKIAAFFAVPVAYFLPEDQLSKEESEKDHEIEFLRGQVEAYKTALQLIAKGADVSELRMAEAK